MAKKRTKNSGKTDLDTFLRSGLEAAIEELGLRGVARETGIPHSRLSDFRKGGTLAYAKTCLLHDYLTAR